MGKVVYPEALHTKHLTLYLIKANPSALTHSHGPPCCCRDETASCCKRAYTQLKLADAQKMMMFDNEKALLAFASEVGDVGAVLGSTHKHAL